MTCMLQGHGQPLRKLKLDNSNNGKHGNMAMLNIGLMNPVKIHYNLFNDRNGKSIETNIIGNGSKKRGTSHVMNGSALLISALKESLPMDP